MRIGVPGEFHEDRWQQTAEDSERCVIPRTREAGGAHRIQVIAWQRETSDWSSARIPCPQVLQGPPHVAKGASDRPSVRIPCPQVLQGHPGVAKGASGRSLARPPCPQLPQGHPGVAKSHLIKDKPVSARCKDQLSYCRAYRQTYRMVSYVGLTDRQTGLPYRQPYLKLSPAGSHGSSLPDGFIRQTYRQVSFQRPDRPASPVARPTSHPHQPSSPAKLAPACLTGRLRSAGRRLRGWRSSRHG